MKDPYPVNLATDDELRERGWYAVSRDSDGHVMTTHVPADDAEISEYLLEEFKRGYVVTNLTV